MGNTNPSAPSMAEQFLDDAVHGLSLDQKLKQRQNKKELRDRGILMDDDKTRKVHKRKTSETLDKFMRNRPNFETLYNWNILKKEENKNKIGLDLNSKLKQRPSWKEVNDRGILLYDPTTTKSHSLQAAQRQLHKRKASKTLDNLLINRPSPNDLHSANIIASDTASLFFGASPTTQVITPNHDENETNISLDILYKDNMNKSEIQKKMEYKLKQRPSISETVARGILLHRTDNKLNYDLQARHKQLHRRKA